MATRTFRAASMLEALQKVQVELGPDAVVLSMREVPLGPVWQVWRRPGYEVIAAQRPLSKEAPAGALPSLPGAAGSSEKDAGQLLDSARETSADLTRLLADLAGGRIPAKNDPRPADGNDPSGPGAPAWAPPVIRRKPVDEAGGLARPVPAAQAKAELPAASAPLPLPPLLKRAREQLLEQGVHAQLVERIFTTCLQAVNPAVLEDENRLRNYLKRQLEAGIKGANRPMIVPASRLMCLVGPSGSGKTSACAKLASYYSLTVGKKVVWVGADTVRAAAISEARTYTDSLGIPLYLVYTPQELAETVAAQGNADLILIDTPGCNPFQEGRVVELGAFLTQLPRRSTYLVAAATMKEADLNQALAAFGPFSINGLILTKMDETATFGSVYNLAWRSQLPLVYLTNGNQAVKNLLAGDPAHLVTSMMGKGVNE